MAGTPPYCPSFTQIVHSRSRKGSTTFLLHSEPLRHQLKNPASTHQHSHHQYFHLLKSPGKQHISCGDRFPLKPTGDSKTYSYYRFGGSKSPAFTAKASENPNSSVPNPRVQPCGLKGSHAPDVLFLFVSPPRSPPQKKNKTWLRFKVVQPGCV